MKTARFNTQLLVTHFTTITGYTRRTDIPFAQGSNHWHGVRIPSINQLCKIAKLTGTKLDDWIIYE